MITCKKILHELNRQAVIYGEVFAQDHPDFDNGKPNAECQRYRKRFHEAQFCKPTTDSLRMILDVEHDEVCLIDIVAAKYVAPEMLKVYKRLRDTVVERVGAALEAHNVAEVVGTKRNLFGQWKVITNPPMIRFATRVVLDYIPCAPSA